MPGAGGPFLMAAHVRTVNVPEADRRELKRRARDKGTPAREVERARIVLLAADGVPGQQIAAMVGGAEGTVVTWRGRYAERGLAGPAGALRRTWPGRPGGSASSGQALAAARGTAGSGAAADPDRATDRPGGDPLVFPVAGRRAGRRGHPDLARHHRPDLAPLRRAAVAGGDLQVLHRAGAGGQDPRRRRAVPASAGEGGGAVRG